MNVPTEALPWISVHRTHIDTQNLREAYKASLAEDYRMILPFLPVHCDSILDIRKGTDYDCLQESFVITQKIYEREGKVERVVFRAP